MSASFFLFFGVVGVKDLAARPPDRSAERDAQSRERSHLNSSSIIDPHAQHKPPAVAAAAAVDHSQHLRAQAAEAAAFGADDHALHGHGLEMDASGNSTMAPGPRYRMLMFMHTEFTDYVLLKEWLILDGNYGGGCLKVIM